jgi:bacterioferritin
MDKTNEIVTELKRSYAIELETMQNYLANSIDLEGANAEPIRKSLDDEIALKLKHARRLAKRINVLGGRLPGSLELSRDQNLSQPPLDNTDAVTVIRGVISANEASINQYQRIIRLTEGLDYVTQDMIIDLLSDERELHRSFLSFLTEYEQCTLSSDVPPKKGSAS